MFLLNFSFYGVNVRFESGDQSLIQKIRQDFSFFVDETNAAFSHHLDLKIQARLTPPPFKTLSPMKASYVSPTKACYYRNGITYVDYNGQALAIYDKKNSACDIYASVPQFLHFVCYMNVLALVSGQLEKRRIHRVHALGLAHKNKAILLLLNRGGGKSTFATQFISSDSEIKLISEDAPLIDAKGRILPFPIRLALFPNEVPSGFPIYQPLFHDGITEPKALIDSNSFSGKIQKSISEPRLVMIGRRVIGRAAEIKPAPKYEALKAFIKNSVIGVGLHQGIEYILDKGPQEVIKKFPIGFSRFRNACRVIRQSQIFEFLLSPDKEENYRMLADFISKNIK